MNFLPDWLFAYSYPHNVNETGISIFPNPVAGQFTIQYQLPSRSIGTKDECHEISIYNFLGEKIYSEKEGLERSVHIIILALCVTGVHNLVILWFWIRLLGELGRINGDRLIDDILLELGVNIIMLLTIVFRFDGCIITFLIPYDSMVCSKGHLTSDYGYL